MDFSDRVKSRMQALNLGPSELADMVGVTKSSVSHWTSGANQSGGKHLVALARALECDVAWLATGEGRATDAVAISSYSKAAESRAREEAAAVVLEMLKKHAGKSLNSAAKQRVAQAVAASLETSLYKVRDGDAPLLPNEAAGTLEIRIPHLDLDALAGDGTAPTHHPGSVRSLSVSEPYLRALGLRYSHPDNLAVVTQWESSMEGTIEDRAPVIVDRGITTFVGDGVYLLSWAGHLMIRRLQLAGADQLELSNDQPPHTPRRVNPEELAIHARALLAWELKRL